MKHFLVVTAFALVSPAIPGAERPTEAEIAGTCKDAGPDTSTDYAVCIDMLYLARLNVEMNGLYSALLKAHDANPALKGARALLVQAERAWISLRDKECAYAQALFGGIHDTNSVQCTVRMTEQRIADLRRYGEYFGVVSSNPSLERP